MAPTGTSACPGCGAVLAESGGATHRYLTSSAACFAAYGVVSARAYEDPARRRVHQLAVDAWAVQHPGAPSRVTDQSVALHLMTLYLFLEEGVEPEQGPALHRSMVARRIAYEHLEPPADRGDVTVVTPVSATTTTEHIGAVRLWAKSAWRAWSPHHRQVREWVDAWRGRGSRPRG
ncbi:MAG: hypothetical protein AVDCRST_MAG79-800 [uncultured Thermoleophilia bacterium]|uniref:Uncharacterized protein n=1 Tax=uncultured Thermoleophilia bacterium TaxID=1497501 RepID=A0A6J4TRL2_9ACTN|nr:MAG: hypothetical protein AVDCRST_MAG79-800 [uncultured Thermoleophilia bacterium]